VSRKKTTSPDKLEESFDLHGGFHLIGTALDVMVSLPIVISDDLRLERPNESQMTLVRQQLSWLDPHGYARQHFETTARHEKTSEHSSIIHRTPLPESEHRYLLLTFNGNGNNAYYFLNAAQLVVPTLWSLLHVYTTEPFGKGSWAGHGADSLAYQSKFGEWVQGNAHPVLDEAAVGRVKEAHTALQKLDRKAHPGAWRAVELFSLFARMPLMQVFDVLAMFMLIEMLLTHNPGDKEIGDSLTHQVIHKIPFVFERRNEQIDYSVFDGAKGELVWKRLYAYRSSVAHGDTPDFASKLNILRSAEVANRFLTDITRRLIRISLDDPKLLEGLKPL
jgi:hypothetical protein